MRSAGTLMIELAPLWGLIFARAAGMFALAPPTGWREYPLALRAAIAALVAAALTVAASETPQVDLPVALYAAAVVRELGLGLLLGLGVSLVVWAAYAAGHLQDLATGLGETDQEGPLARLFYVLAVLFFLQLNGQRWLIAVLSHSCRVLPPGTAVPLLGHAEWVYWPATLLADALQLAAPALLAIALAAALLASLQRVLPALGAQELLTGARALAGLVAIVIVAPLLGSLFLRQMDVATHALAVWLQALAR